MRHAILGMGGVGGFFGAKLCQSGADVHFLVRHEIDTLRVRGLHVHSPESPMHISPL